MDIQLGLIVAGLFVGFVVGMTGVGGGSLMTPILLWFGIPPTTAVGTDLLYAAFTKMGGVFVHHKKKQYKLGNYWLVISWECTRSNAYLMDFKYHKNRYNSYKCSHKIQFGLGFTFYLCSSFVQEEIAEFFSKTFWR